MRRRLSTEYNFERKSNISLWPSIFVNTTKTVVLAFETRWGYATESYHGHVEFAYESETRVIIK